jgi:RNA polymerase sigma-70 factor, ECF subfamily
MTESNECDILLRRYQDGDMEAARLLVVRSAPVLFRSVRSFVESEEAAEDILQDAWLRIHAARHTWRPGEAAMPWLLAIVRHARLDHLRRVYRKRETALETLPEEPAARPPAAAGEIDQMLRELPASQREVVLLLKVEGLSLDEVARATGATVSSVKQRASRAYARLRTILTKGGASAANA